MWRNHTLIEAQFWQNEAFVYSRRFDTRALAVQWSDEEQQALTR